MLLTVYLWVSSHVFIALYWLQVHCIQTTIRIYALIQQQKRQNEDIFDNELFAYNLRQPTNKTLRE
jgi:hypothetical protein